MSTDTRINGQNIEKDNLIFEVLGCLDESSVQIGAAKLKAGDEKSKILTQIQKDIAGFSSLVAGCNGQGASPLERSELNWLETQIKQIENQVDVPQGFVLPGKSEFETRLNLARVAVRKAERRLVSLNRYQDLPSEVLDYFNRLSWLLFLLAISH